jgi:hypothetical protein
VDDGPGRERILLTSAAEAAMAIGSIGGGHVSITFTPDQKIWSGTFKPFFVRILQCTALVHKETIIEMNLLAAARHHTVYPKELCI